MLGICTSFVYPKGIFRQEFRLLGIGERAVAQLVRSEIR